VRVHGAHSELTRRGIGLGLAAGLALIGVGCTGGSSHRSNATPSPPHVSLPRPVPRSSSASSTTTTIPATLAVLGLPLPEGGSPLPGYLLIADRDNNRLVIVNPRGGVVWEFPQPGELASGQQFGGPDDAFLTPNGTGFITNEEFADTIALIALAPRPHITWEYGHYQQQGSSSGYLAHPDDAYLLPNGLISSADIINCRVLWINQAGVIVRSLGHAGDCSHNPPYSLSEPNGDTPLPDGGVLVTEIGGWVDRLSSTGQLLYSIRTPTTYPSDGQLLPNGDVLVAGFNTPGRVDILTPSGHVTWTYGPVSGPGELDRPSLAVQLPNGMIAVTDDWHHRVVLIDPSSDSIVWQYGHDGIPGAAPGYLDKPDGLALIR
jgi:hypothetical protein